MSNLIDCPDCGHKISTKAKFCPDCGREITYKDLPEEETKMDFGSLIIILISGCGMLSVMGLIFGWLFGFIFLLIFLGIAFIFAIIFIAAYIHDKMKS